MRISKCEPSRGFHGHAPPEKFEFTSFEMAGNAFKLNKRSAKQLEPALKRLFSYCTRIDIC